MSAKTTTSDTDNATQFPISRPRRALFWSLALALGFLRIWAHRHDVNPDGLEYIEIAWAGTRIGLRAFINGYWSPLYPFLLSTLFRIFHPTISFESTAVQLLNLAIYLMNLACFELFLSELLRLRARVTVRAAPDTGGRTPLKPATLATVAYLFFIWTSYVWLSPTLVTPDVCVAALTYLAMAFLLSIRTGRATWAMYGSLGAALGLAYLAKAAMFPMAFFFLASAFLMARSVTRSWAQAAQRTALAAIIFLLIAAPLVLALSTEVHRLSFGESGRDNYAWYVNRSEMVYWQGGPADMATPAHPARQLLSNPPLLEFATPIPGSFPPGYEPSYWYEGLTPHFELFAQVRALLRAANFYFQMFSRTGVLYIVFLGLWVTLRNGGRWTAGDILDWKLWLPAYAALGLYALVHVEPRFVSEFALMLLLALFASAQIPQSAHNTTRQQTVLPSRFFTASCLSLILTLAPAIAIGISAAFDLVALQKRPGQDDFRLAEGLAALGAPQPQSVATVGIGPSFYWAHLVGVRVIADIPNAASYWAATPQDQAEAIAQIERTGATAIVARGAKNMPEPNPADGWKAVTNTTYFVRQLP